jgi:DNA polymerase III sliding clamp (beta) subunit (PCNA family)
VESELCGIGEMARASGLSVSALRFYDGAGVLVPAWVDPVTGYRRYAAEQIRPARLVARLRRVGMPLADIGRVLGSPDAAVARAVLDAHLRRLEGGLADARRELSLAHAALDALLVPEENPMTTTTLTIDCADLAAALDAVRFAVGREPALPVLAGVLFDAEPGALRLVATDRYRLAVAEAPAREQSGPPAAAVVPAALADEVRALLSGGPAVLTLDGASVAVRVGPREVRGERLDGDYPDYRRLLRIETAHRVTVDVAALRDALATGATRSMVREQDGVSYDLSVLAVEAGGVAVASEEATAADGALRVGVNREFLLEALAVGGRDQLVLELGGPIAPLAVRVPGEDGPFSIVMPTRL